jgi:hypothetical protein
MNRNGLNWIRDPAFRLDYRECTASAVAHIISNTIAFFISSLLPALCLTLASLGARLSVFALVVLRNVGQLARISNVSLTSHAGVSAFASDRRTIFAASVSPFRTNST